MGQRAKLKFDVTEEFEHLPNAPIIEAVIDIRAQAEAPWEEADIQEHLKPQLPDYPKVVSTGAFRQQLKVEPGSVEQSYRDLGWKGLWFQSADDRHIAQFNRESFVFSRLYPYESWEQFSKEAFRLWRMHIQLANPTQVQRLGLRFINRMPLMKGKQLKFYLESPPKTPRKLKLTLNGFFHQDKLRVPGHPYAVNITRTVLPPDEPGNQDGALILDIDVFSEEPFELRNGALEPRLAEMRWLKNRAFFGSITHKALESFR
jgi:uncharacterized protein (TIGR04255 family)